MTGPSTKALRNAARSRRRSLDEDVRHAASLRIQRRFLRSNLFLSGRRLSCYIATPEEVDTGMIFERAWRAGKAIYAPVTGREGRMRFLQVERDTPLKQSALGLWEPVSGAEAAPRSLDTVLAPVVAFDASGNRIGTGGGYYDRAFEFLKRPRKLLRPKLVGLAFDCQRVEKISPNPWDIRLYRVINETG